MLLRLAKWSAEEFVGTFALVGVYAMALTPADITATTIALAALVTAIGTAVANIMSARRVAAVVTTVATKTDENTVATLDAVAKIDEVKVEAREIKGHVNSAATAAASKIDALEQQVTSLIHQIAEMQQTARLLAQAAVIPTTVVVKTEPAE